MKSASATKSRSETPSMLFAEDPVQIPDLSLLFQELNPNQNQQVLRNLEG
jgi:hypothetical protein